MNGEWFMNRGFLIDIPAQGGPVGCLPSESIIDGCISNLRPLNGGIPAAPVAVTPTGSNPAQFVVPPGAFSLPGGPANRQTVAVAVPQVIQLASQFSLLAPAGTGTGGGAAPAGVASFQPNAFQNDPIQVSGGGMTTMGGGGGVPRLQSNFTWCPPDGNCNTTTLSQQWGKYQQAMIYTSGANKFGGTMNMMLRNTGVVSLKIGAAPAKVLHQLVGGTSNPLFGKQVAGGGYANNRVITLEPGLSYSTYMIGVDCQNVLGQAPNPPGCGIIATQGDLVPNPSPTTSMNLDWGMPWTTGTVTVANVGDSVPTNLTAMGSDARTPLGAGRITMVAGGTTERQPSSQRFAAIEVINLHFASPVPLLSWPSFIAMMLLLALAGGYMASRRYAGESV